VALYSLDILVAQSSVELPPMPVNMVRGDTRPTLEFTVKNANGVAINLTGSTPRFRIRRKGTTTVLITRVCTLSDPSNGKCQFAWAAADWNAGALDAPGSYEGELEVTFSDATVESGFDIVDIFVREQVG